MKLSNYLVAFMMISLWACKNSNEPASKPKVETTVYQNPYPLLPDVEYANLYNHCTYVDYIFEKLPFSVSQNEDMGVKANILFIGRQQPATLDKSCRPIGREFFQVNNEVAYEAEVYFSENCKYYLFLEKGKPKYSAIITESGQNFYNNLVQNAAKLQRGNIGK